ncbi:hypothetical protein MIR68_006960 [Amoeboaphelidium protococcarum]|nr:hypothetical protein MIR68_006960 [Amoeboaphelidium protococcarum]
MSLMLLDVIEPLSVKYPHQDIVNLIWVITDLCPKFIALRPLKNKLMHEVAQVLWQVIADYGAPRVLQAVKARNFATGYTRAMMWLWYPANVFLRCIFFKGTARFIVQVVLLRSQNRVVAANQNVAPDGFLMYKLVQTLRLLPLSMLCLLTGWFCRLWSISQLHALKVDKKLGEVQNSLPGVLYVKHLMMVPSVLQRLSWIQLQYSSILATTRGEFQVPILLQYKAFATSIDLKLPPKFLEYLKHLMMLPATNDVKN